MRTSSEDGEEEQERHAHHDNPFRSTLDQHHRQPIEPSSPTTANLPSPATSSMIPEIQHPDHQSNPSTSATTTIPATTYNQDPLLLSIDINDPLNLDSRSILGILQPHPPTNHLPPPQLNLSLNPSERSQHILRTSDPIHPNHNSSNPSQPPPSQLNQTYDRSSIAHPPANDGPPQSIMIDITHQPSHELHQHPDQPLHTHDDDTPTEASNSPSPSLTRHRRRESQPPEPSPLGRPLDHHQPGLRQHPSSLTSTSHHPSTSSNPRHPRLAHSILHDHRPTPSNYFFSPSSPSSSSVIHSPINHHPQDHPHHANLTYPRSSPTHHNFLDRILSFDLISKLRSIWDQERNLYYRPNQTAIPDDLGREEEEEDDDDDDPANDRHHLNSFSHHNQQRRRRRGSPRRSNHQPQQTTLPHHHDHQLSPKEMALWRWVNVDDLDRFLQDVYSYYVGNGIWAIGLSRLCNLMTVGFVIGFSFFLLGCIDYSILRTSHHLDEVLVPQCVSKSSGLTLLLILGFSGYYSWRVLKFGHEISNLWKMHGFFTELLEVPESDIQTIPWYRLVEQLASLKDQHPATIAMAGEDGNERAKIMIDTQPVLKRKLDAHEVANQIMREQNYLIALFNKDILDLRPPGLPSCMIGNALIAERHLTTSLEWNLVFCLRGFLLDHRGQVRPEFLVSKLEPSLAIGLQRRFRLMAGINLIFGPFIILYVLIYSFFRYFEEYHKNPSSIGSRSFTRLAKWKFREYNELPHLFQERLTKSCCLSKRYIDHFPKIKTTIIAKFVSFLAGSFAGVLIVLSLYDPDAFLHFEISKDRSVIFYIGLFGSILAISRGMIKQEYEERVEGPGDLMEKIIEQTHYLPAGWYGKLHGLEVFNEFGQLFQLKVVNFLHELMSVLLTPFILWYNFDQIRCQRIVQFFREFTIHVDGIGYVCSFSVFDFDKLEFEPTSSSNSHPPQAPRNPVDLPPPSRLNHQPNSVTRSNDISKMERSLLNFVAHHPNWEPSNQAASLYLSKAIGFSTMDSMIQPSSNVNLQAQLGMNSHTSPIRQRLGSHLGQFSPGSQFHRNRHLNTPNPHHYQRQNYGGIQNSVMMAGGDQQQMSGAGSSSSTTTTNQHPTFLHPRHHHQMNVPIRSRMVGTNSKLNTTNSGSIGGPNGSGGGEIVSLGGSIYLNRIQKSMSKPRPTGGFNFGGIGGNSSGIVGFDRHRSKSSMIGVEAIDEEDTNTIAVFQSNQKQDDSDRNHHNKLFDPPSSANPQLQTTNSNLNSNDLILVQSQPDNNFIHHPIDEDDPFKT